jgi:hypothetical protein
VCKSFEATGIILPNASKVLNRFNKHGSYGDTDLGLEYKGNKSSWKQLCCLVEGLVKDKAEKKLLQLSEAIHLL